MSRWNFSPKHWIKVHRTNPVLKQDPVIDYLNEPHEKYALVPIDKAATNMAIICKKYHVTVTLKEMKRMKKLIKIRKKLFKIT